MRSRSGSFQITAMMIAVSALACSLLPAEGQTSMATSVAATVQHLPSPSPLAPVSPARLGEVSGVICYPAESTPAMTAIFQPTSDGETVTMAVAPGQNSYELVLPEGEYVAYAWVWLPEFQFGGSYSQAVPCGLDISCADHSLRSFLVGPSNPASGIDLCDWYGGPGAVPTPPGGVLPTPLATETVAPGGISLNCDGSQQRVRVEDGGAAGRTAAVDTWLAGGWVNVWSLSGGDPMIQQIEPEAGPYRFGECRSLIAIPIRYSGSGADLRLDIYAWDGAGVRQVYSHSGTKGAWAKLGDTIQFKEARFLYGEPNCCPCAMQTTEHTWDGRVFVETRVIVEPTYSGTPPDACRP